MARGSNYTAPIFPQCCFTTCYDTATTLVAEDARSPLLFKSGAGLVCDRHAEECVTQGRGVRVRLRRSERRRVFG